MKAGELVAGRYRLQTLLGSGGFGEVWRGQDENLGRAIALKLIHEAISDETARARFLGEARITASLGHPHVVSVLDFGLLEGGQPFLVYELVEGGSLEAPGRVTPALLRGWGSQLAEALGAAHDAGVLHRDLKPENVLLRGEKEAVLCDFGIARQAERDTRLTAEGLLLGTPAYMAPELWLGSPASPASDQFAWAATLVRIAGGGSVYGSEEVPVILDRCRRGTPLSIPAITHLPDEAAGVLGQALDLDPHRRFPSIRAAGRAWSRSLAAAPSGAFLRPAPPARVGNEDPTVPRPITNRAAHRPITTRRTRPSRGKHRALWGVILMGVVVGAVLVRPSGAPAPAPTAPGETPASKTSGPTAPVRLAHADLLARLGKDLRGDPIDLDLRYARAQLPQETLLWLRSPTYERQVLAVAEAVATVMAPPPGGRLEELSPGEVEWVLRGAMDDLRDVLWLHRRLAAEVPEDPGLSGRLEALRGAFWTRLGETLRHSTTTATARQLVVWMTLADLTKGRPTLEAMEQAADGIHGQRDPLMALWMRYRLVDALPRSRMTRCPETMALLRRLAGGRPRVPLPAEASPARRAVARALDLQLLYMVFRAVWTCPSAAGPADWHILDTTLLTADRYLVRSPDEAARLHAHYKYMLAPEVGLDALTGDPQLVQRFKRRIQLRQEEAAALTSAPLPEWMRDLPERLDELDRYLGADATLPFSEGQATGGSATFEPLEAARRLDDWLDRCEDAFRTPTAQLPSPAWAWLSRHLLFAPSRLLRALQANLAELRELEQIQPGHEEAWDRVLARIRALSDRPIGARTFGGQRRIHLGHWLLAQAGESIPAGQHAVAAAASELEIEERLRSWIQLALMDSIMETTGGDCGKQVRALQAISSGASWRKDPWQEAEGYRRLMIDGTALAARCPELVPDSLWPVLMQAVDHVAGLIDLNPGWVAQASERALEAPRLYYLAQPAPPKVAELLTAINQVYRVAEP